MLDEPPSPGAVDLLALSAAVLGCVFGSSFFSFSETCLTSLPESRAQSIISRDPRRNGVLLLWIEKPHEVLTTILVGNNLANIIATALMTRLAMITWGEAAVTAAVGIMTFLVLVFGEVTPKTLARQHAARLAVPVMQVLRFLRILLFPVTWLLSLVARLAVRLTGGDTKPGSDVTEDEIQAMIDLGSREGMISGAKARYLRSVFDLGTRSVREVLVARREIEAINLDASVEELLCQVAGSPHSRIPAYRGTIDDIVGILHARDLLQRLALPGARISREELEGLLREPLLVPETMVLERLLRLFRRSRQHLVVVLDEFGGTMGIVTLEDVLEELVGEIWDEHDEAEAPVLVRRGPGRWHAHGRLPASVLEKTTGIELSREGYDTLAGLLLQLAGEVPAVGRRFELADATFEVLSGDEKKVGLVSIELRESGSTGPRAPAANSRT